MTHFRSVLLVLILLCSLMHTSAQQTEESADSVAMELQEVIVSATGLNTQLKGTTLVTIVAGSGLHNIGSACDVLRQLPLIDVDDNEVTVVGRGAPEIYIDEHKMHDADELVRLSSKNIMKVELDMAPGAQYSSSLNAVIRITTRRDFMDGLSIMDRGEFKVRRKLSVNDLLDLNYCSGNWDVFAVGNAAHNNSRIKGHTINQVEYNGADYVIGSSQDKFYPANVWSIKTGTNYSSAVQSVGAYYRCRRERNDYVNYGTEWLNDESPLSHVISQATMSYTHNVGTYYDQTFGGVYHLHFDGDFVYMKLDNEVLTEYPESKYKDVSSSASRHSRMWAGKLYMRCPLAKGDLTIGMQDSYTLTGLKYRMLNDDIGEYIPSSATQALQLSVAPFITWTRQWGKFGLSAGFRYEYVDYQYKLNHEIDAVLSRRDHMLTPDMALTYTFDDKSQMSLSYKASAIKPPYSHLTGSLNYVGTHEIEGGNSALRDERMHNIQLFGLWHDFILQADYIRSVNTYAFVKRRYHQAPSLQLLLQPVNIDVSATSLYLVWTKKVGRWSPNITIGMYQQNLRLADTSYNRPIFSYSFENTLSLYSGYILAVNARGQTGGDMHTNRFGSALCVADLSVSKLYLNKMLQFKLIATDIFNTANDNWSMHTFGVSVDKRQRYDRRGISISVTYRFHPRPSKYKGIVASEAELQRL